MAVVVALIVLNIGLLLPHLFLCHSFNLYAVSVKFVT